jgi:hypothetical protein
MRVFNQSLRRNFGKRNAPVTQACLAANAGANALSLLKHKIERVAGKLHSARALVTAPDLPADLRLADAGGIESGRDQEQMLCGAFTGPGAQPPLRFPVERGASAQELKCLRPEVDTVRGSAPRVNELNAIAGSKVSELGQIMRACEVTQVIFGAAFFEGEVRDRLRAALAPGDSDHSELFEQVT